MIIGPTGVSQHCNAIPHCPFKSLGRNPMTCVKYSLKAEALSNPASTWASITRPPRLSSVNPCLSLESRAISKNVMPKCRLNNRRVVDRSYPIFSKSASRHRRAGSFSRASSRCCNCGASAAIAPVGSQRLQGR